MKLPFSLLYFIAVQASTNICLASFGGEKPLYIFSHLVRFFPSDWNECFNVNAHGTDRSTNLRRRSFAADVTISRVRVRRSHWRSSNHLWIERKEDRTTRVQHRPSRTSWCLFTRARRIVSWQLHHQCRCTSTVRTMRNPHSLRHRTWSRSERLNHSVCCYNPHVGAVDRIPTEYVQCTPYTISFHSHVSVVSSISFDSEAIIAVCSAMSPLFTTKTTLDEQVSVLSSSSHTHTHTHQDVVFAELPWDAPSVWPVPNCPVHGFTRLLHFTDLICIINKNCSRSWTLSPCVAWRAAVRDNDTYNML